MENSNQEVNFRNVTLEDVRECKAAFLASKRERYLMMAAIYAYAQSLKNDAGKLAEFLAEPYFNRYTYALQPKRILAYCLSYLLDATPKTAEYRRARRYANALQKFFDHNEPPIEVWTALCRVGLNALIEENEENADAKLPDNSNVIAAEKKAAVKFNARFTPNVNEQRKLFKRRDDEADNVQKKRSVPQTNKVAPAHATLVTKEDREIEILRRRAIEYDYLLVKYDDLRKVRKMHRLPIEEEFSVNIIKTSCEAEWFELEVVSVHSKNRNW